MPTSTPVRKRRRLQWARYPRRIRLEVERKALLAYGPILPYYGPISVVTEELSLDLAAALGAEPEVGFQVLTLYIPDKDRAGVEYGSQRRWVLDAAQLLAEIGGGVTILPPVEGGWHDPANEKIIWERPVILYTYVKPDAFMDKLPALRDFIHRMGLETAQGEVVIEFDRQFFRIREFVSR